MKSVTRKAPVEPANQRGVQHDLRRQNIIPATEKVFLEHGYVGASINQIVRVAGGALATLYAEFGTKEKLFEALARRRTDARRRALSRAGSGPAAIHRRLW